MSLRPTRLIQRLQKAPEHQTELSRGFGGGPILNEAWSQALGPIMQFEYMGNSNFELDTIPKALQLFIEQRRVEALVASTHTATVEPSIFSFRRGKEKPEPKAVDFYILGTSEQVEYAAELINRDARGEMRLEEPTNLQDTVFDEEGMYKTTGWMEVNNGFFYFSDFEMFNKMAQLFEIEHDIQPPAQKVEASVATYKKNQPKL